MYERKLTTAPLLFAVVLTSASARTPTWTYDPQVPDARCPVASACEAWRNFRITHSWPYQTFAIKENAGTATIVLSEPPPAMSRDQLDHLLQAMFGDDLSGVFRARWPTGVDGWLEDVVLQVRLGRSDRVSVVSGENLRTWQAPADVTERLQLVYRLFYGTLDGFVLERVGHERPDVEAQIDVRIPVSDISGWLSEPGAMWAPVNGGGASKTTREISVSKSPGYSAPRMES